MQSTTIAISRRVWRLGGRVFTFDRSVPRLLLVVAVGFNLYHLYPEVAIRVPNLNDGVLHLLAVGRVVWALVFREDPTDVWLGSIGMGFPLFHYYQHLPYFFPAILHLVSLGTVPLEASFNWTRYLLLSLFPLSVYWSMRRFGFDRLPAAMAGLLAPLVATNGLYGLDLTSYVWGGYGLYTQLWGMLLLPLALAQGYATLREGRGYAGATLLLAVTLLSHLVLGYMAFLSLALFALLPAVGRPSQGAGSPGPATTTRHDIWRRGMRFVLPVALVALVTAYFLVPALLDSAYVNRSVWEEPAKYNSYGYAWVLRTLVAGDLFDFGRWPSLTLLVAAGLAGCVRRWREERYRLSVALFVLWLLLYFGRSTWGALLDLLPMSRDLHLHRLIAGVHLGGIYLMGLGLALAWQWVASRRDARSLVATALVTTLLLVPVYRERAAYLNQNARWMGETGQAFSADGEELEALVSWLQEAPPGRVYAGQPATWGKDYRVGALPMDALLNREGLDTVGYLYHALSLNADVQALFDESRPEQYDLFNIRYVVAPAERTFPDFVRPVRDFGRHRLYQVTTTGYFDLVASNLVLAGERGDLYAAASAWLRSDLPQMKQHPTVFLGRGSPGNQQTFPLSRAGQGILQTPPREPLRGRILFEAVESNAYLAEVEVLHESVLLLKVTYHPNWHAIVDGVAAEAVMLIPSYVGVKVSPGIHHIRLEYRSRPLRGTLLLVGLLALPIIALTERQRASFTRVFKRVVLPRFLPDTSTDS